MDGRDGIGLDDRVGVSIEHLSVLINGTSNCKICGQCVTGQSKVVFASCGREGCVCVR